MNSFKKEIKLKDETFKKMLKLIYPIKKDFEKIYENLNEEQLKSLFDYKNVGYLRMNNLLHSNKLFLEFNKLSLLADIIENSLEKTLKNIQNIDSVFNYYKLKDNIYTFRGIGFEESDIIDNLKKKENHLFKSFVSTSFYPNKAFEFSTELEKEKNGKKYALLEFELPKNFPIFYLTYINLNNPSSNNLNSKKTKKKNTKKMKEESFYSSEFEVLLPRNCVFKIYKMSTIEEKFYTSASANPNKYFHGWNDYEKYLNTNNNVKKIKVYHLKFVKFEEKPLPNRNNISYDLSYIPINNLYYIPYNKKNDVFF